MTAADLLASEIRALTNSLSRGQRFALTNFGSGISSKAAQAVNNLRRKGLANDTDLTALGAKVRNVVRRQEARKAAKHSGAPSPSD